MNNLGSNINEIRKRRGMTLKELAEKTGFSISFLSQLERGKSSSTLESLKKISLALEINPGYFFNDEEEIINNTISEVDQMEKHDIYYKDLATYMESPAFSPLYVVLKPYQNEGNLISHPGQEFLYVLEGQLTVQLDGELYILGPSESIMFDSKEEHYWYNYTNETVRFLCISYDRTSDF